MTELETVHGCGINGKGPFSFKWQHIPSEVGTGRLWLYEVLYITFIPILLLYASSIVLYII